MVIVNNAAVGADRHINAGFLIIFVTCFGNFNYCGCLAAADTFLFTGNADGTAADTYFNKVCAAFGKETEACCVNYVACANFYAVAVMFTNPCQSNFLPFAVTFGRVDAEYVNACVNQCRYAFCIVAGVNACAYDMAFFAVQKFQRVFFVGCIIFAEYHVQKTAFVINNRQGIQFVFPDDVVGFLQSGFCRSSNHFADRSHEFFNFGIQIHAAYAVVTAGNNAFQFAVNGTVTGNGNSAVAGFFLQGNNISQGAVRADVGIAAYKTCTVGFNSFNHCSFVFNGLGTVNKGNAAFLGEGNCHFIIRYRLHDSGNQRNVHGNSRFFAFFEFNKRSSQIYICRNAFAGRITGN